MADIISPVVRSRVMSRIRGKDTKPEMIVRRCLHAVGLRYRLHRRNLPGAPDIVFPSRKLAVFVHGCFWHGCPRCRDGRKQVKSNEAYWAPKLARNKARDARHAADLGGMGWTVRVIWECETRSNDALRCLASDLLAMRATA
jgi:DNA mismatch endonuclease (patch repair protein)